MEYSMDEIQQNIIKYGAKIANFDVTNPEVGLLTGNQKNPLGKIHIQVLSIEIEKILKQFVNIFEQHNGFRFEGYDSGILFQYIFDKVVEATYKVITDVEVDTQFIPKEPFEYHEPDLPEYIQLKLTNVVGKVGLICCKTVDFIDQNNYRTKNLNDWLLPLLIVAAYIGIEFAQEIDLNDDSEMQNYLNL